MVFEAWLCSDGVSEGQFKTVLTEGRVFSCRLSLCLNMPWLSRGSQDKRCFSILPHRGALLNESLTAAFDDLGLKGPLAPKLTVIVVGKVCLHSYFAPIVH